MKVRIMLKITSWILIIVLGIIHFLNREDLSVFYSGFKGLAFNVTFFIAIGLLFFANPSRPKKGKTVTILLCIGCILLISGIIFIETQGVGGISLSLVFVGVIMVISSDFLMEDFKK